MVKVTGLLRNPKLKALMECTQEGVIRGREC